MRRSSRKSTIGISKSLDSDILTRVSTRRSSILPFQDDLPTTVGNFTTKFSMSSFIKKVEDLTPLQRTAIENVGFGKLIRIPHHTLRKNLLVEWMDRWESEKRAFVLLDRELTITPMDAALLLGLRAAGKPVTLSLGESFSNVEEEYGADRDTRKISLSSIERRLQSLGESADDEFVRTFLLFIFGALLFPNSNGKVDSRLLSILEDLSEVSHYAWGVAVIEDLFTWLCRWREEQVKNVEGCLILLQIWSYEHIDIGRPNLLSESLGFPRACRWEGSRSNTPRHLITAKFNELEEDQVVWKLEPVASELNIQIIKELLVAETGGNADIPVQHLNATITKGKRSFTHRTGLPPKSFRITQRAAVDEKKLVIERGGKHDQADCPESSCLSADTSVVTVDHLECSSSYDMKEVIEGQVGTSRNLKDESHTLKTENLNIKKENVELRKELDVLRTRLLKSEEIIQDLRLDIEDLKDENTYLNVCTDGIKDLERLLLHDSSAEVKTTSNSLFSDCNETDLSCRGTSLTNWKSCSGIQN